MNVLGIFVKHPIPGHVKTRLAADVGNETAAELYAAFLGDVVERFRGTADRRLLCYAPDDGAARDYFHQLARGDFQLWPQPEGALGERLGRFFADAFEMGAKRVAVIGSDSPTLPVALVAEAFDSLSDRDCVLGPATDGGYYLIGQKDLPRAIFDQIDWSEPTVLRQTVARMTAAGARPALLTPWYDVDSGEDLELLRGHISALRAADEPVEVPRTEAALARMRDERRMTKFK